MRENRDGEKEESVDGALDATCERSGQVQDQEHDHKHDRRTRLTRLRSASADVSDDA